MSVISYFFKISMALRSVHNRLVEEYGIPYWGSYVLFAFATILLGAILGLVCVQKCSKMSSSNHFPSLQLIVCLIDLLFPAKPLPATEVSQPKQSENKSVGGDERKDDETEEVESSENKKDI